MTARRTRRVRQQDYRDAVEMLYARGLRAGSVAELSTDVDNPHPDRRARAWYAAPRLLAGHRFAIVDDGTDGVSVLGIVSRSGGLGGVGVGSPLGRSLIEKMVPALPTLSDILRGTDDYSPGAAAVAVLEALVAAGAVSLTAVAESRRALGGYLTVVPSEVPAVVLAEVPPAASPVSTPAAPAAPTAPVAQPAVRLIPHVAGPANSLVDWDDIPGAPIDLQTTVAHLPRVKETVIVQGCAYTVERIRHDYDRNVVDIHARRGRLP